VAWADFGRSDELFGLVESGLDSSRQPIGIPYGSIARMILLYLQTEAVKTQSREVELARIIHRTARNRPRPPNTWARDFIAKNFIKQPIRIVVNDIKGLALIAHFS